MKIHYLAYGSNLHPVRLRERVPSAEFIGLVLVENSRIEFSKKSKDGSGKATLEICSEIEGATYGALFEIAISEMDD